MCLFFIKIILEIFRHKNTTITRIGTWTSSKTLPNRCSIKKKETMTIKPDAKKTDIATNKNKLMLDLFVQML